MTDKFMKWPSIEKFNDKRFAAAKMGLCTASFRPKIKLHGTNSAVRLNSDGSVIAQKRSADIGPNEDNAGFRNWMEGTLKNKDCTSDDPMIIFGEWAGPGVQSGDAVAAISNKAFFVFSITKMVDDKLEFIYEPSDIERLLPSWLKTRSDVFIVPWYADAQHLKLHNDAMCDDFMDNVKEEIDKIDKEDPYIKEKFGVSGPGEGLVFYAVDGIALEYLPGWMFKVKTDRHSVNKGADKKPKLTAPDGMEEFIEMFVTENRFNQIVKEENLELSMKNTGAFLKAFMQDVIKESRNEIEAAGWETKDVTKFVATAARNMWMQKC